MKGRGGQAPQPLTFPIPKKVHIQEIDTSTKHKEREQEVMERRRGSPGRPIGLANENGVQGGQPFESLDDWEGDTSAAIGEREDGNVGSTYPTPDTEHVSAVLGSLWTRGAPHTLILSGLHCFRIPIEAQYLLGVELLEREDD